MNAKHTRNKNKLKQRKNRLFLLPSLYLRLSVFFYFVRRLYVKLVFGVICDLCTRQYSWNRLMPYLWFSFVSYTCCFSFSFHFYLIRFRISFIVVFCAIFPHIFAGIGRFLMIFTISSLMWAAKNCRLFSIFSSTVFTRILFKIPFDQFIRLNIIIFTLLRFPPSFRNSLNFNYFGFSRNSIRRLFKNPRDFVILWRF